MVSITDFLLSSNAYHKQYSQMHLATCWYVDLCSIKKACRKNINMFKHCPSPKSESMWVKRDLSKTGGWNGTFLFINQKKNATCASPWASLIVIQEMHPSKRYLSIKLESTSAPMNKSSSNFQVSISDTRNCALPNIYFNGLCLWLFLLQATTFTPWLGFTCCMVFICRKSNFR